MRQFWSVIRSRAGLIFGGATLALLMLPVTASAISVIVPGTRDVRHAAGTGQAGVSSVSTLDFVWFFGVVAAVLLLILIGSRLEIGKALKVESTKALKAGPARRASAG